MLDVVVRSSGDGLYQAAMSAAGEEEGALAGEVTIGALWASNLELRPKLLKELKSGTRLVSHSFDMGDWKPEQTLTVENAMIYYWTITPDLAGKVK